MRVYLEEVEDKRTVNKIWYIHSVKSNGSMAMNEVSHSELSHNNKNCRLLWRRFSSPLSQAPKIWSLAFVSLLFLFFFFSSTHLHFLVSSLILLLLFSCPHPHVIILSSSPFPLLIFLFLSLSLFLFLFLFLFRFKKCKVVKTNHRACLAIERDGGVESR